MANTPTTNSGGNFFSTYFPTFYGLGVGIRAAVNPAAVKVGETLRHNVPTGGMSGLSPLALFTRKGSGGKAGAPSGSYGSPLAFDGTSRAGSPTTASPLVAGFDRLSDTYSRRDGIQSDWQLVLSDPRISKALEFAAWETVKNGFTVTISGKGGVGARTVKQCQSETDAMLRRVGLVKRDGSANRDKQVAWLIPARVEGDFFGQVVVNPGEREIVDISVMPAASMERMTDLADQFPDVDRAFVQFDIAAQTVSATFAAWQIIHKKYRSFGSDRYGQGCLKSVRQHVRSLRLEEDAQTVRRITNAARIETYTVGDPVNGANDEKEIQDFIIAQGFDGKNAKRSVDPYEANTRRVFNPFVKASVLPSDPNIGEVQDIELSRQNVALGVGGGALALQGWNNGTSGRDEMTLIKEGFLSSLEYDEEFLHDIIVNLIELQLVLKGLNPDSVTISLGTVRKTTDTFLDTVNVIVKALSATLGAGNSAVPHPPLTDEQVADLLRPYINIHDVPGWIAKLKAMAVEQHIDPDTAHSQRTLALTGGDDTGDGKPKSKAHLVNAGNGTSNTKTTSPTTGYGADKHSSAQTGGAAHDKVQK